MEATKEFVGNRTMAELEELLNQGYKFVFVVPDKDASQVVTYEVHTFSEDGDIVLFISTPDFILYQGVYDDLATLNEREPISLSKFLVVSPEEWKAED